MDTLSRKLFVHIKVHTTWCKQSKIAFAFLLLVAQEVQNGYAITHSNVVRISFSQPRLQSTFVIRRKC